MVTPTCEYPDRMCRYRRTGKCAPKKQFNWFQCTHTLSRESRFTQWEKMEMCEVDIEPSSFVPLLDVLRNSNQPLTFNQIIMRRGSRRRFNLVLNECLDFGLITRIANFDHSKKATYYTYQLAKPTEEESKPSVNFEKGTWLFLRVGLKRILRASNRLFKDKEMAHKVGMKAAKILRKTYLADPTIVCGKSTAGLIGAALYVACFSERIQKSQLKIVEALENQTTCVTISSIYKFLLLSTEDINDRPWVTYSKPRRRAEKGERAWIKNPLLFDDDPLLSILAKRIKDSYDKEIEEYGYIFRFSGKEDQFITRKPVEKEEE